MKSKITIKRDIKRKIDLACHMIQTWSHSVFEKKFYITQLYAIEHILISNSWIELKLYQTPLKLYFYVGVKSFDQLELERLCDIGHNRRNEFCYLIHFG